MTDKNENEFVSISKNKFIDCYQVQIKDGKMEPVFLGEYHEIPVPVNKVLKYNNKKLIVVTYILTKDEIDNKLFKILGIVILNEDSDKSSHSIDLVYNDDIDKLQTMIVNHSNKDIEPEIINTLDKFPKNEDMISELMESLLNKDVLKILI